MIFTLKNTLVLFFCALIACVIFFVIQSAFAQQTDAVVIFSWKTDTFVPEGYTGKALPVPQSKITISAQLLINNQVQSLDNAHFRWLVENKPILTGDGKQIAEFSVNTGADTDQWIRVQIEHLGQLYEKDLFLQIQKPELVFERPHPQNEVRIGKNSFAVQPFFFSTKNPDNIDIDWEINNQAPRFDDGADKRFVDLNIGEGVASDLSVRLGVSALNKASTIRVEYANEDLTVNLVK